MKFNNLTLYFLLIAFLCGYIKNAVIVLFIVLFHELGHIIIAKILGYKIIEVVIYPFGGVTKLDKKLNESFINDFLLAIFGVIFQMFIHLLCIAGILQSKMLYDYNLAIMLFNLLPIIPLDGSKILLEFLCLFMPYKKALKFYSVASLVFITLYFLVNYHYNLNNYLIIGLFLSKTYEALKNKGLIFSKFILERRLYNLNFSKIKNKNEKISNYFKDTKYYYYEKGQVIDEKSYLNRPSGS